MLGKLKTLVNLPVVPCEMGLGSFNTVDGHGGILLSCRVRYKLVQALLSRKITIPISQLTEGLSRRKIR
jgi:hypothetical protein